MTILGLLIPAALILGFLGLCAFLWALRSGQFEDLDGAAYRILLDDEGPREPGTNSGKHANGGDPGSDPGAAAYGKGE